MKEKEQGKRKTKIRLHQAKQAFSECRKPLLLRKNIYLHSNDFLKFSLVTKYIIKVLRTLD